MRKGIGFMKRSTISNTMLSYIEQKSIRKD